MNKIKRQTAFYVVLTTLLTHLVFRITKWYALIERGYNAIGGEYTIWFLWLVILLLIWERYFEQKKLHKGLPL